MRDLFLALAILGALWGIVSLIVMASYLSSRGIKISIIFFKVLALRYIHQYREITRRENGRSGPRFYSYIVAMNLALVFAVAGMLLG